MQGKIETKEIKGEEIAAEQAQVTEQLTDITKAEEIAAEQDYIAELLKSEHPYSILKSSSALKNNIEKLNRLDLESMREFATRVALNCPAIKLAQYCLTVSMLLDSIDSQNRLSESNDDATSTSNNENSSNESNDDEASTSNDDTANTSNEGAENFLTKLEAALHVRSYVQNILDPNNHLTDQLLIYIDSFIEFNHLALSLIKDQEILFAERLTLNTPLEDLSRLSMQLYSIFRDTDVGKQINIAFSLKRDVTRLLLSNKPEDFFFSREFNSTTCLKFPNLLNQLLKNEEEKIGTLLADITSPEIFIKIQSDLENLNNLDSFKLVAAAFSFKKIEENQNNSDKKEVVVIDTQTMTYPNTLFRRHKKSSDHADDVKLPKEETLRDENDEKSCCEKYCTLF